MENSIKPYGEDDSGKFRPIIKISFNSCEPVEFSLRDGWKVTSSSENETVFSDADFSSGVSLLYPASFNYFPLQFRNGQTMMKMLAFV